MLASSVRPLISPSLVLCIAGLATIAAHAAIFTFIPTCAPFNWNSQCAGAACGGGQFTQSNNFGNSSCGGIPLLPGALDDVFFAGNGTINAGSGVRSITINPGVIVTQTANISTVTGYTNSGTVNVQGANKTYSGFITNAGTWNDSSTGLVISASTTTFTNDNVWNLENNSYSRFGSSTNTIINNGSLTKLTPAGVTFTSIAFDQNGVLNVQDGSLSLTGTFPNTFGPTSVTNTSATGTLNMTNTILSGNFSGFNGGTMNVSTLTLPANLTLNVTGNPINWTSGNLSLSGNTLQVSAATDVLLSGSSNRSISSGSIINNGDWTEDTGGFITSASTVTFTNNGTMTLAGQQWSRVGSSNNFIINNGTFNKTTQITSTLTQIGLTQSGTMNI